MLPSIQKLYKEIAQEGKIYNKKVNPLFKKIEKLQEKCQHPPDQLEARYGANTGGYDGPDFNSYWADFQCLRCGKSWGVSNEERKANRNEYCRAAIKVDKFTKL